MARGSAKRDVERDVETDVESANKNMRSAKRDMHSARNHVRAAAPSSRAGESPFRNTALRPSAKGGLTFSKAARRVQSRLLRVRWFGVLRRSALPAFLAAGAVLAVLRLTGRAPGVGFPEYRWTLWALVLVAAWLGTSALWASASRPTPLAALAFWDERAGRNEMFASAYCFERSAGAEPGFGPGKRLHLVRASERLAAEAPELRRHVPAPFGYRSWTAPLVFVAFAASGLLSTPLAPEDLPLGADARRRARAEAESIAEESKLLDPNGKFEKGLTEKERAELEKLKRSLGDAADKMKKLRSETPREVLEDLERRAREAEKLAAALGESESDALSEEFIAELGRHADTAGLAAGLGARDLQRTADEAGKLRDRLSDGMSLEASKRLEDALGSALARSTSRDRRTAVGSGCRSAKGAMKRKRLLEAAREFDRIARHFRRAAERKLARRRLQGLAERLRRSGTRLFGRSQSGMRRLARARYAARGASSLGRPVRPGAMPPGRTGLASVRASAAGGRYLPGMASAAGRRPGAGGVPVPGSGLPFGGTPRGWPGGTGGMMPGAGAGAGAGQTPVPGSGTCGGGAGQGACQGSGQGAGVGGLQAGWGSAPYGNTPTVPLGATTTRLVASTPAGDGPAEVRRVESASHSEEAARSAREVAMEAIRGEEEALAEEPLPLSRRDQVLRYFTALRKQIEGQADEK